MEAAVLPYCLACGAILMAVAAYAAQDPAPYFPPPESKGGWRTLTDAQQVRDVAGMDLAKLDETWEYVRGLSKNSSLLVVRRGWLVFEQYQGAATRDSNRDMRSCGKAFTSTAISILMRERPELFPDGLEQLIYNERYLPLEAFPIADPRRAHIKLGQLLCMTSGIPGNNPCIGREGEVRIKPAGPDGGFPDHVAFGHAPWKDTSAETLWTEPGTGYSYASAGVLVLAAMLRKLTGMEMAEYMRERVFEPIGCENWSWDANPPEPDGSQHTKAQGGIRPTPRDAARFGYLHLRLGRWGDEQIVPEPYARAVREPSPYNPFELHYSMLFRNNAGGRAFPAAPADTYSASGAASNHIYIVPSLDMVVVRIGDIEGTKDSFATVHRGIMERVVGAVVPDSATQ